MQKAYFGKSEKGSSSVLVIMVMLALVIFGTLAMTSAFSDLKLARKSVTWVKDYYALDSKGENFLKMTGDSLDEARSDALAYLAAGDYIKTTGTALNDKVQQAVRDAALASNIQPGNGDYALLFRKLFYYFMTDNLETYNYELRSEFDFAGDTSIYAASSAMSDTGVVAILTTENVKTDAETQSLEIELDVICPKGDAADAVPLYRIAKWDHIQQQFDYSGQINLWDGKTGK